jgi:hypothetical protein
MDEFQMTKIPPEAPTDGKKAKLSNILGQKFLIKRQSNFSHFVSWRQIM